MNRSSHSDHPEYNQSIYPMTRQELAVAPVSWTRLKARPKQAQRPTESVRPHFTAHQTGVSQSKASEDSRTSDQSGASENAKVKLLEEAENADNENRFKQAETAGQFEVAATQVRSLPTAQRNSAHLSNRQPEHAVKNSATDSAKTERKEITAAQNLKKQAARADLPEKSPVAKPKYLKHAVRFGGPSTKMETDQIARHQEAVSKFQKQQQPIDVDNPQLRSLHTVNSRGVDSRGQVYSNDSNRSGESAESPQPPVGITSTAAALDSFLGEHHRSVPQMPIIKVTPERSRAKQASSIPAITEASDSCANHSDAMVADSAYPYWLQAIIQIVIGTIIVILVMNLTHRLLSGSTPQLIQRPNQQQTFPVQQANSEIPEDESQTFIR